MFKSVHGWFSPERIYSLIGLEGDPGRPNPRREAAVPLTASPDVLSTSFDVIRSSQARERPVVMITCAADGRPWACVPDAGELRVIEDRCLRVAIWPDSPTAIDLDRGEPVLLIVTGSPDVHLIRATARRLADAAMAWAHYDLTITSAQIADRGTAPYLPQFSGDIDAREEILESGGSRKRLTRSSI
ncbi:hypothetical protein [Actinomadura latina]|uniref:Pyridoxamine 5'-phosphate oxidase putative domain-containing protein n=1 Tax=Actinomadura latina TaxID=163603 RepID=A0A846YYM5_9ACTN|nr:hypothetical protein [Actinomadura latina]NKZ03246.1 hypothetical protein [Actinomadura latina]